jgi:hypothetical protein
MFKISRIPGNYSKAGIKNNKSFPKILNPSWKIMNVFQKITIFYFVSILIPIIFKTNYINEHFLEICMVFSNPKKFSNQFLGNEIFVSYLLDGLLFEPKMETNSREFQ